MRAIILVDRSSVSIAGGDLKTPITIPLSSTVVQDMEVISEDALIKIITEPLEKAKAKPTSVIMCFTTACSFQKEIPEQTLETEVEPMHAEFDENVPFNRVLSKVFTQSKKRMIIGINKDLASTIRKALIMQHWTVDAIVPTFALYGAQPVTFSSQVAEQIMKHYNSLQQVSFSLENEEANALDPDEKEFMGEKKQGTNRVFLLVGVFIFLVLILIMVYMLQQMNKKNAVRDVTAPAPAQQLPPTQSTPTEEPTPIELIAKDQIAIQVLNGSGIPGEADRVKSRLAEADFTNVLTGNAPTQEAESTSIVVKSTVPREYREEISTMIKSLGLSVTLRENDEIENDILITTYQQAE